MWLNNCVGHDNYRVFYSFLLFTVLTLGLFLVWSRAEFVDLMSSGIFREKDVDTLRWKIIDLAIFGGGIAFLFVFFLLVFHSYVVLTNQTTIEIRGRGGIRQVMTGKAKTYKLPYNIGVSRNVEQIFGTRPLCGFWIFSWFPVELPTDGLRFPTTEQASELDTFR
jgi:palmitoyltransferase